MEVGKTSKKRAQRNKVDLLKSSLNSFILIDIEIVFIHAYSDRYDYSE